MNILGIDFEDWFHPELIKRSLTTEKREPKVIDGLNKILEWLRMHEISATFFVVGELIQYKPDIMDRILNDGHEIAFHTMTHKRLHELQKEEFDLELKQFAKITNKKSKGFRAPTFSLDQNTSWVISCLEDNNYTYDSSIVPVKTSMYGINNAERIPYKISANQIHKNNDTAIIHEFPLAVTKFLGKDIPAAGGFYIRTLPVGIIKNAIRKYEDIGYPATFYVHSWELTPEFMPRIKMSKKDSFITFHNIHKTMSKMDKILEEFEFSSFENFLRQKN